MSNRLNHTDKNRIVLHFHSVKMQQLIYCGGPFEFKMYRAFEFDDTIAKYKAQPFKTPYLDGNGEKREYKQDTLVKFADGSFDNVEIKLSKFTKCIDFKNKFSILARHYEALYGKPLALYTEERYSEAFFENSFLLYRYIAKPITPDELKLANSIQQAIMPFSELKDAVLAKKAHLSVAFRLAAHKIFKWDFNAHLDDSTIMEKC